MQHYIAKVYTSSNPDLIETISLPTGEIDVRKVCEQLAAALWTCDMKQILSDASEGEISFEIRSDLAEGESTSIVLYDMPRCERDPDFRDGDACDAHNCDCEGDIYLITLDPTE